MPRFPTADRATRLQTRGTMADILVRLAGKADVDWCVRTATLDSNRFAEQVSGLNEVIVAGIAG